MATLSYREEITGACYICQVIQDDAGRGESIIPKYVAIEMQRRRSAVAAALFVFWFNRSVVLRPQRPVGSYRVFFESLFRNKKKLTL